ncbi:gamma carbonic anhydrase family protein, partial [bacterium]
MIHPYQDKWPTIGERVFLAEGSHVIGDVTVGEGSSIWFNTVVRGDVFPIRIGRKTNIQDNCTIHV